MGSFACELLTGGADFCLGLRVGRSDDLRGVLRDAGVELALDVTRAGLGLEHGMKMLEAGVRPVIGTSGVDASQAHELDAAARELGLGGIVVPNFSLGMALLQEAAARAAAWFPNAEIIEFHRAEKADSPSGTAIQTAAIIGRARSRAPLEAVSRPAREFLQEGIAIHSVRLPGLLAHQEVIFGSPGEILTFRHDATARQAYGPGILLALAHASAAVGVDYGLRAALESRAGGGAPREE